MVGSVHSRSVPSKLYDLGRIVSFSDGVVAIGITLLILPLANIDLPSIHEPGGLEAAASPLGYIWQEYQTLIISSVISWIVIFVFWLGHHRCFEQFQKITSSMILWNALWLFAIVVLPFPTNLLGQENSNTSSNQIAALYLFNQFILGLAISMVIFEARRNPQVYTDEGREKAASRTLWTLFDMPVYLLMLTVLAFFIGVWALWGLFGMMLVTGFTERLEKISILKKKEKEKAKQANQ